MKVDLVILIAFCLLLAGCGGAALPPTAVATEALTPAPSATPTPVPPAATWTATATPTDAPTQTHAPTATKAPTHTPRPTGLPMPEGTPVAEWNGIPVMPEAIAGEGDAQGYLFTILASSDEVQAFYERKLAALGWGVLGVGQSKNGAVLLIFMKNNDTFSISIIDPGLEDGVLQVLMVK